MSTHVPTSEHLRIICQSDILWLTPVVLATQEAEIRRITVQNQPRQIVRETLSQKNPSQRKG
jgi:hypothetical protein